jgi:hypothetical protein
MVKRNFIFPCFAAAVEVAATTMLLMMMVMMMMIRLYKDAGKQTSYFSISNNFYINFQAKCETALMKTIIFSRTPNVIAGTKQFRATFSENLRYHKGSVQYA